MRPSLALPLVLVLAGLALERASSGQDAKPPEKKTGFIGIQMDAVAIEGSPQKAAIRVVALVPGSPAEAVGVRQGDLILALNGEGFTGVDPANAVNLFRERLKPFGKGETVKLQIQRSKHRR